jgi:hypothetical protein
MDDLPVVDPVLGKVPFWKSLIYNTAKLRNAVERADSVAKPNSMRDEDRPPRLAADRDPDILKSITDMVDALEQRITDMERRRAAEAIAEKALIDAERTFTSEPDECEDDANFAGGGFAKSPATLSVKKSEA